LGLPFSLAAHHQQQPPFPNSGEKSVGDIQHLKTQVYYVENGLSGVFLGAVQGMQGVQACF
jgi:hypothetical protein